MTIDRPPGGDGLPEFFLIAELAGFTGLAATTIRHYERLGLVTPHRRGNLRIFMPVHVERLNRVIKLRRLALPLKLILQLIDRLPNDQGWLKSPLVAEALQKQEAKRAKRFSAVVRRRTASDDKTLQANGVDLSGGETVAASELSCWQAHDLSVQRTDSETDTRGGDEK